MSDGQTLKVPVAHTEVYVTVQVTNSETFQRNGYDIHSDAGVSFTQAILGGQIRIPGLNGPMDVKVHTCTYAFSCNPIINPYFLPTDSKWYTVTS